MIVMIVIANMTHYNAIDSDGPSYQSWRWVRMTVMMRMILMIVIAKKTDHNDDLRRSNIQRWRTQQLRKSQIQNSLDWRRRRFMMLMMMTRMMRKAMTWTLLVAFGDKYNGTISVKLMSENLSLLMNLVSLPMSYSCINCFWCLTLMVEKENVFGHFLV